MDIWSVLKACFRRWYVFLPALAATAWFAWWQTQALPPTYLATSSATIAGPALVPGNQPGEVIEVNPFEHLGGSLAATGTVMTSVMDATSKRAQFRAEGVTADYEVNQTDSVIYFDVSGHDAQEVVATATRLPQVLDVELAGLQQRAVEAPESRVRAVTLTVPDVAEQDPVPAIRVLAVLLALGVILSVALALLADALLGTRARRREAVRSDRARRLARAEAPATDAGVPAGPDVTVPAVPAVPVATGPRDRGD